MKAHLNEAPKYYALPTLMAYLGPEIFYQDCDIVNINGGSIDQEEFSDDDIETKLDSQYAVAMAANVSVAFYGIGSNFPNLFPFGESSKRVIQTL